MKLKYNILWFEDDPDIVNDKIGRSIIQYLKNLGFIPNIDHHINGEKLEGLQINNYDLIISDLNLGIYETGDIIIKKIRDNFVFTEVLLYSATPEHILNIIENNERMIERISFAVGINTLATKIKSIIDLTIKKVQDVNNMRGLVIAETIDLETKIEEMVKDYFALSLNDTLDNIRQEAFTNICNKKIEACLHNFELTKDIQNKNINLLIEEDIITVYDLYSALQSILKEHIKGINKKLNSKNTLSSIEKEQLNIEKSGIEAIKEKLKTFNSEIIEIRNTLAHVKEKNGSNGEPMLESLNKNGTTICFNEKKYADLRLSLTDHSNNLLKIQEYFENLHVSKFAAATEEIS